MIHVGVSFEHSPASALEAGLARKAFRGNPESPGMVKLDTANVARDFVASPLLGHCAYMNKDEVLVIQ